MGNRIEANHFYALEMEAYSRELRAGANQHGRHWRLWERLLVSLNFRLSRHGQSYWQPLLGVLACAALIVVQQANLHAGWVVWPDSSLWLIEPLAAVLNGWASGVIIIRPLYAAFPAHEAFILLMALLLSTCIWHFLVGLRAVTSGVSDSRPAPYPPRRIHSITYRTDHDLHPRKPALVGNHPGRALRPEAHTP